MAETVWYLDDWASANAGNLPKTSKKKERVSVGTDEN